ncbi:hypothetical protein GOBAR_AA24433 [Gossypium barbadense]|uniref:Major facilitator superfamily (MFS) profile domain-containing protein n=1 Tax=Gossypium barbadense TaxID=3634 RepID=A0A2P5WYV0_GOSBA|nr:hypothetical protein GOBAR_AA24433 [Gossypium barbadense]
MCHKQSSSNSIMLEPTIPSNSSPIDVGWASFNGREGPHWLKELDLPFLSSYAIGVHFAGHVGDRIDLRLFLVFGMMGSGYFICVQVISGAFQSIGLPCVVAIAGNWFGKEKRELIMEVLASHTSVGNIISSSEVSVVLGPSTAIRFLEARRLPGVAPFALCLFFSKPVAYTLAVGGIHLSRKTAGIISTIFDIGGVFSRVMAGFYSDIINARSASVVKNITLMFLSRLLVNTVDANLGTQYMIKGNSRALATVTAIIDGTGSVGRALGPLLAGYISTRRWNSVVLKLIVAIFLASLFLIHVAKTGVERMVNERKVRCSSVRAN